MLAVQLVKVSNVGQKVSDSQKVLTHDVTAVVMKN